MFRPINITAVANGWVVQVGCQSFAFTSVNELTGLLGEYLKDPDGTEKRITASAVNIRHTMGTIQANPAGYAEVAPPNYPPPPPMYEQASNLPTQVGDYTNYSNRR